MSNDLKIEDDLQRLSEEYTDEEDQMVIKEWGERWKRTFEDEEYLKRPQTVRLVEFIKGKIKIERLRLSSTVGMEKVDNLACHTKIEVFLGLLELLAVNPEKERRSIEAEISAGLERVV